MQISRTDEAVSATALLAMAGTLISTAKTNSDTLIDRIVRIVRRLLRPRFFKMNARYFTERSLDAQPGARSFDPRASLPLPRKH